MTTPCLVTFTKPAWEVRFPTIPRKLAADSADIPVLGEDDLPDLDRGLIGLNGSPTRVRKTYVPDRKKRGVMIREESAAASVSALVTLLRDAGILN